MKAEQGSLCQREKLKGKESEREKDFARKAFGRLARHYCLAAALVGKR